MCREVKNKKKKAPLQKIMPSEYVGEPNNKRIILTLSRSE